MRVEDEYTDVLQNIEASIVSVYREDRDISDSSVIRSLEALMETYIAEQRKRSPRITRLTEKEKEIFDRVKEVCDWRMGRGENPEKEIAVMSTEEIIRCMKRILKSVARWNKEGGSRGYLTFVSKYV